jgi:proline dehydrogenase
VRGAYMEKERARAGEMGYKSPIQLTKEDTDNDFNAAVDLLIANHEIVYSVIATHNADSTQLCLHKLDEFKIAKNDPKVYMAQLFGMSDNISMNVAHEGYNVVKYLPFGPLADVMPYLFRRAEENTSVKGQTGRELQLIKQELQRRKK